MLYPTELRDQIIDQFAKRPKPPDSYEKGGFSVGVAGFEPTTSWSQTRRDTGLRYTPNVLSFSD